MNFQWNKFEISFNLPGIGQAMPNFLTNCLACSLEFFACSTALISLKNFVLFLNFSLVAFTWSSQPRIILYANIYRIDKNPQGCRNRKGAGGRMQSPPSDFGISINPTPIGGTDYTHHIPTHPTNFQTFLRPWIEILTYLVGKSQI